MWLVQISWQWLLTFRPNRFLQFRSSLLTLMSEWEARINGCEEGDWPETSTIIAKRAVLTLRVLNKTTKTSHYIFVRTSEFRQYSILLKIIRTLLLKVKTAGCYSDFTSYIFIECLQRVSHVFSIIRMLGFYLSNFTARISRRGLWALF